MSATSGRPEAETYQIQRLVDLVLAGEVRIPPFQRPFRWNQDDVLDLLDSVHRGFPIGTLLLWRRPAEAAGLDLGPIHVDAPAHADALWVVDGQQRILSLVAVLQCPEQVPSDHRKFEVFFDLSVDDPSLGPHAQSVSMGPHARSRRFVHRPHDRPVPPTWLPMNVIVRPETLDDWIEAHLSDKELRRRARLVSNLFREYEVPAYIVNATDETDVITMFDRTNNTGRGLAKEDVFNALHAQGETPTDLRALATALAPLRFGAIEPKWLLKTLFALRDKDVTQIRARRFRDLRPSDLSGALADTERALERAIVFLRRDADIPHVSLLPYRFPLLVLARFFHAFPEPQPRSRALLARWVWAGAITGEHRAEKIPYVRESLRAVSPARDGEPPDEEACVQRLLTLVSWSPPWGDGSFVLGPHRFGTAESRLHLAALAALSPRSLDDGSILDIGPLLAEHRGLAVRPIVDTNADNASPWTAESSLLRSTLANRALHPPSDDGAPLLPRLAAVDDARLRSHGFDPPSIRALRSGDVDGMLTARSAFLGAHIRGYLDRHARWIESRRRSLASILAEDPGGAS